MLVINKYTLLLSAFLIFILSVSYSIADENSAELYYSMGQKYLDEGKFELAVLSLKNAVQMKPDWAEAHNALGMAYYQLFRFNEAIIEFDRAIQYKPYYTEAKINKNRTMRSLERYEPEKRGLGIWAKLAIVIGAITLVATSIFIILT
jgi:tetratricopeptide (TPR) repeat protein